MNKPIAAVSLVLAGLGMIETRGAERPPPEVKGARSIFCVGRVEPVGGEIEVSAQLTGTLRAVHVAEGDCVTAGAVLAEVEATREQAALALAEAKLARLKAGHGAEEIAATEARRDALAAELTLAESEQRRAATLRESSVLAADEMERRQQRAMVLRRQVMAAQKDYEAMKRGALPEELAVAAAEVAAARAEVELRLVRAASEGVVLAVHRHEGDFVAVNFPTPILRLADTRRLRVRLEVGEQDACRIKEGASGEFTVFGGDGRLGRLVVRTVLPAFAPRRLFEPDSTAIMDTRVLQILCEIEGEAKVFTGQRVTAVFAQLAGTGGEKTR